MIKLTREPARIPHSGTFPLPGFHGVTYTIGNDAVLSYPHTDLPDIIAVDIEGCGLTAQKRLDVKAVIVGHLNHSLIFDPRVPAQFDRIRTILNSGRILVYHNSPFDVPILYMIGLLSLEAIDRTHDTLLHARLAEPDERTSKSLHNAANRHLGLSLDDPLPHILKVVGWSKEKWFEEGDLDIPNYRVMAASDAVLTYQLKPAVEQAAFNRLTTGHPFSHYGVTGDEALHVLHREQYLNRKNLRRTAKGIRADLDYLDQYRSRHNATLAEQVAELERLGIKPGHSGSLTSWLSGQGLIPEGYPVTTKTKMPSGSAEHLGLIDHPIAELFIAHKKVAKTEKDYLAKVADMSDLSGRIHPQTSFLAAQTGRASMQEPPLHQFDPAARGIIIPDDYEAAVGQRATHVKDGKKEICQCKNPQGFTSIDWSQIEPVLAANISGDVEALAGYESGTSDLYMDIALFAKVPRDVAKTTMLAQLYGEGLIKLATDLKLITNADGLIIRAHAKSHGISQLEAAQELGITGYTTAYNIKNRVFSGIPRTRDHIVKIRHVAQIFKVIVTLSGRIVPVPSGWYEGRFSVQTHKGVNFTMQGGAYDILAETLFTSYKAGYEDAIYFSMHDELIVDSSAANDIRRIMETPPPRLEFMAKRKPVLHTDMLHLGERWTVA